MIEMFDYAAAKSGIIGLTKALAKELGEYNINVNCVSPGRVNQIIFDEVLENMVDDGAYIQRNGKNNEVASVVCFLASDDANFITGQNYVVDGGQSLGLKCS
ncbi:MAG: SDR family oxidoreductase [Clostridia bacterium]|nr:SDR family oxidoreductase [Clostridia bacterium]